MLTQKQRLKIEEFSKGWGSRLFFLGDYCPVTSIPMQCQPVDSASMNLEGLRRHHVEGVKRTSDPLLMVIQDALRYVIGNTAGGLFFASGYGGADPVDAVMEARDFIFNAVHEEQHSSVYKACEEITQGDIILAATRVCPHCGHTAVEKCTRMTAKTIDEVNFISKAKKELYIQRNTKSRAGGGRGEGKRDGGLGGGLVVGAEIGGGEGGEEEKEIDLWPLSAYSSVALEYARELADHGGGSGDVEWKCTKTIRGTFLVNGTRFRADRIAPNFGGVDLTSYIGEGITFSPTSTIHSFQGITFEGGKLYLDMNMIWDVRMLTIKQLAVIMSAKQTRYMGEGVEHRTEKARQFGLARAAGQGAIEEYPVGDGRFIADLAVFDIAENGKMKLVKLVEVVVTSPPTKEKLAYYKELGLSEFEFEFEFEFDPLPATDVCGR
ncbi:hypothetical protein T492DRAFT_841452 [Pavlovales sp. CCMP2436]|nr:hypothetical protein T492DRAFT_841452 [Pavlovales sp. CCMP2436]